MAIERILHPDDSHLPPSQRAPLPAPAPGTDEAAFVDSLNDVYGSGPDPEDAIMLEGIRRAMGRVLTTEKRSGHDEAGSGR